MPKRFVQRDDGTWIVIRKVGERYEYRLATSQEIEAGCALDDRAGINLEDVYQEMRAR